LIQIVLAQQGALVRAALAWLLSQEEDLQVIAELDDLDGVLTIVMQACPPVVVLYHALPATLTISELCADLCAAASNCAVLIVLDGPACPTAIEELARLAPRVGILASKATPSQLIEGIHEIVRGEPVLDINLAMAALTAVGNPLTDRERQVLRRAAEGAPAKEIAAALFLSTGTVRNYLSRSINKTGARTRIEAIRIAHDAGWI
jgi:two-component system response regulator DesR